MTKTDNSDRIPSTSRDANLTRNARAEKPPAKSDDTRIAVTLWVRERPPRRRNPRQ